ncbi:hypothetical protein LNP07_06760 [Apilactobacillus sp. M161]|uniref:Uncharacterized protein n=1 Tax=Apilactobacillus xinyiensis TaxID=2841032 RepID=A0ABT0I387_9LACO|nr:hypothetical protein [Apilactobacillus xinyiensis]MCK8625215.1 hypothetical protein [Apilactobacillus xinyiensis]
MNKNIKNDIAKKENEILEKIKPNLDDLKELRSLFITDNWHNILNSTPKILRKINRATELDLIPCFDGLTIESKMENNQAEKLFKFLQPFIYHGQCEDFNSKNQHKLLLDYTEVCKLAILRGVISGNLNYIKKNSYKSCIHSDHELKLTKANGTEMPLMQNITVNFNRNFSGFWNVDIWVNPNKFIRSGKLQEFEPLLWFTKEFIISLMPKPRIKEIHINIDLGVNYAHITVYDNYYRIKKEESHKGSTYANNGVKQHFSMPFDLTNLKHSNIYNSIVVYDKTNEIINNQNKKFSYLSDKEIRLARRNNINITRIELRSYNSAQSFCLLKNNSILNNRYSFVVSYLDKDGKIKRKKLKDALNKAYKHVNSLVTGFILVTDEVLSNTYKANN